MIECPKCKRESVEAEQVWEEYNGEATCGYCDYQWELDVDTMPKEYFRRQEKSLVSNYLLCVLSGGVAYLGFMFYGMSTLRMGKYDFASWSIYMALIIAFSNIWGLIFHEWKGSSKRTLVLILSGIFILVLSVIINGFGAYLASIGK